MAQTNSNVQTGVQGNLRYWRCDFTTATGDNSLTFTHGLNFIVDAKVDTSKGGIEAQNPKVTHSAGVATATFDNTQGYSGTAYFLGR